MTDVTGIYFQYKATAVGEAEVQLNEILEKEYTDDVTLENGMKLVSVLSKSIRKRLDVERIDGLS